MEATENQNIEIALLLEAIHRKYGYDFRDYAKASVRRRILRRLAASDMTDISQLQHRVLHDQGLLESLLLDLSINTTEMFRDPAFFLALRQKLLPIYADRPTLKIWHAGCATGEEVYSMAILLAEAGLTAKTRIYATDFNEVVLGQAREGILPIERLRACTANYQKAGGRRSFSDYYTARYDSAILSPALRHNVVFSDHNLVTDDVFAEVDIVICRNVMIYFGKALQERVYRLFLDSLSADGFLCLGSKESLRFAACESRFESFAGRQQIYRRRSLQT